MKEVSVFDLKNKIDNNDDFILLDVREIDELNICSIDGAVHIPMNQIPDSISNLNKEKEIIAMCHSGIRSMQVCHYLLGNGYNIANLSGGIDEWAKNIDREMQRY
tara:strand:- start:11698 stop:12012 length:315 start_codon:yes stop_codon:yes gene_type:complete